MHAMQTLLTQEVFSCTHAMMTRMTSICHATAELPDDTFMTYLTSSTSSGDRTRNSYKLTRAAHVQHIQLAIGNHYAVTDWNPKAAPHQVCAL